MSKYMISIDQSISKTAFVVWKDDKIVNKGVLRTADIAAKNPPKDVPKFVFIDERMDYICHNLEKELVLSGYDPFIDPLQVVMEGLSFGSVGDATRNLAGLYFRIRSKFEAFTSYENFTTIAPTSLKSFAREYLPEGEQVEVSPKSGKTVKTKMSKKRMVEACENTLGKEFLKGLNMSTGKDDLADAYFLGKMKIERPLSGS